MASDWCFSISETKKYMVLDLVVKLAKELLSKKWFDMTEVLELVFGVWAKKLRYAAHQCNRVSHTRQLNSGGGGFITVVWLLTTSMFHGHYSTDHWYRWRVAEFFETWRSTQYKLDHIVVSLILRALV
jgi:hypothetical protein